MSAPGQKRRSEQHSRRDCFALLSGNPKLRLRLPRSAISGWEQTQQGEFLFNDFVSGHEKAGWHIETKCLRRLEVEDRLVLSRCLHRKVPGIAAAQDTVH